ncbi:alcohol oxidase, partial [Jaminaea rosea]
MIDSADEAEDVVDYIVVGGGTAGLAIARRLSDDPSVRVLVIEAGQSGEGAQKQIRQPNSIDYNALQSSELDWHYETAKQDNLNGRQLDFPLFKTLGGTSAGNDLIYLRQGRREADAMAMLAKKMGGLDSWSWEKIDGAMNSSVTYQAVAKNETSNSAAIAAGSITGKGPIMLTYPNASLAVEEIWFPALQEVHNTPLSRSPWQGDQVGGIIAPITVEKGTSLRSYSRSAYLDSVCDKRHNLQVLTTTTVTRIFFEDKASEPGHLRALGVECASSKGSRRNIITAKREVIVSAGVIGSPQLLQVSGIGPRPVLEERGIAVKKELSGVGQHLQDSLLVSLQFHVKKGVKLPSAKSVPGYADSALAILSLKDVLHTDAAAEDFITRADKLSTKYYNHNDTDGSVKLACLKTGSIQLHQLLTENATTGLSGQPKAAVLVKMKTANDLITFTISLQSPLSRGNVNIASSNPFDAPRIDPAYLSHPSDEELLIAGIEWARTLSSTKTFKKFLAKETSATSSVRGRKAWAKWFQEGAPGPNQPIKGSPVVPLRAGYQASSTNSLLAEEDGGVVGADFKVHGCSNLRVVDASVLPLAPSASLGAYVYGIAEMAAGMIHADRKCGKAEPVAECQYGEEDDDDGEEAE